MKTLLQAAIEFEASRGGRSMGQNWSETEGVPYLVTNSRDAFMAGAAAMAELFASGQAVKIEQAPRKYLVEFSSQSFDGKKSRYWCVRYIILSYDMEEARKISEQRFKQQRLDHYYSITAIHPAVESDVESEKEIV